MKCRVIQKGQRFYAQYERTRSLKGGKFYRTRKEWETLNNRISDQRDGDYELDYFFSKASAERALKAYAEEFGEGEVVSEFEV